MKTVEEESDFPLEELVRQLLYLNGSFSADSSALPPAEQLKSPKIEIKSPHSPSLRTVSPCIQLSDTEFKEKNLKEQKRCKCKKSRCLKLYCQCFATGTYCNGCSCSNCENNIENETARHAATAYILEHYPKVFRPKIVTSPNKGEARCSLIVEKFEKGCHCKRSECLKGYCECYHANILCSEICKCFDCKNCKSSEERSSLESKKRKTPVNLPRSNMGTPFNYSVQHYKQEQICTPSLRFSKFKHRSMIADIDLMDVCLILLGASASVNILSGKGSPINIEVSLGPIALTGDKKEDHDCNTDTYIEKEKLVLVKFRDFLDRIIARGNIKDKWSTSHGSGNSKV